MSVLGDTAPNTIPVANPTGLSSAHVDTSGRRSMSTSPAGGTSATASHSESTGGAVARKASDCTFGGMPPIVSGAMSVARGDE